MKFSRLRTLLLTFTFGLLVVSIHARLSGYFDEIPVRLPEVQSNSPLIIRVCPETLKEFERKKLNGEYTGTEYFTSCFQGGGAG